MLLDNTPVEFICYPFRIPQAGHQIFLSFYFLIFFRIAANPISPDMIKKAVPGSGTWGVIAIAIEGIRTIIVTHDTICIFMPASIFMI
jgi:hypothetical protein